MFSHLTGIHRKHALAVRSRWSSICIRFIVVTMFFGFAGGISGGCAEEIPKQAFSVGYLVNTFSSGFDRGSTDLSSTGNVGSKWYLNNFFGTRINSDSITVNSDHSLTLPGDVVGSNGQIATAAEAKTPTKFVGKAFGGGAYIEARLKFDPESVAASNSRGWPAFWAMALEHLVGSNEQWEKKPLGYSHFIEVDVFESDIPKSNIGARYYGANLHDWSGIYHTTCTRGPFCDYALPYSVVKRRVPENTDFTRYHSYGFLWVPATATKKGYARFYFDGQQVGEETSWEQFIDQQESPDGKPWEFGIIDKQHLVLLLGSGAKQPITISTVNVWQKSDVQNLQY